MFLLRSAFWLGLAFMIIQPASVALTADSAGALGEQAVSAGKQVIAQKVAEARCDTLECVGGKAAIAAVLASSKTYTIQSEPQLMPEAIPFPHPRLDRKG